MFNYYVFIFVLWNCTVLTTHALQLHLQRHQRAHSLYHLISDRKRIYYLIRKVMKLPKRRLGRCSAGVRKPLQIYCLTAPTLPHVVWEGFKKISPHSSKNNLQHNHLLDTTGTSNGTGFYGQMKQKNKLFNSKHSRWIWWTQGKKVSHVYNGIYYCIFDVVCLYFCWRSWTSCLDTWHRGFYQMLTEKKK